MSDMASPYTPTGESKVVSRFVTWHGCEGGCIYQIAVPRNTAFAVLDLAFGAIPEEDKRKGELTSVHNPWDIEDDDDNLYLSLWCSN